MSRQLTGGHIFWIPEGNIQLLSLSLYFLLFVRAERRLVNDSFV